MESTATNIKFPQNDNTSTLFNVFFGLPAAQALHVAHELNLFGLINECGSRSLENIAAALHIEARPARAIISMCVSLGLIQLNNDGKFELTDTAKSFLLKESPFYLGGYLDLALKNPEVCSFKSFKNALLENASQIYKGQEVFKTHEEQIELAKFFTRSMHGKSIALAGLWPNKIDLSQNHCLLDIGGGSGAHSIGAVSRWPNLKAIIYDRPGVIEVAEEYINQFGLKDRIQTQVGDMWKDPFPPADIHFYCDIFHDWTLEQCKFLAKKSYDTLKPKGRIVIHEMLFNENKTGPYSVASYNIMMLIWTQGGQQLSRQELVALLEESGFIDIKLIPIASGDCCLVEGQKE